MHNTYNSVWLHNQNLLNKWIESRKKNNSHIFEFYMVRFVPLFLISYERNTDKVDGFPSKNMLNFLEDIFNIHIIKLNISVLMILVACLQILLIIALSVQLIENRQLPCHRHIFLVHSYQNENVDHWYILWEVQQ